MGCLRNIVLLLNNDKCEDDYTDEDDGEYDDDTSGDNNDAGDDP